MCIHLSGTPGWKTLRTTKVNITPVHITLQFDCIIYIKNAPPWNFHVQSSLAL